MINDTRPVKNHNQGNS